MDKQYYKEAGIAITVTCELNTGVYAEEQVVINNKFCVDEDGIRSGPLVGCAGHNGECEIGLDQVIINLSLMLTIIS